MSKANEKTLHTITLAIAAFLVTVLVVAGGVVLYQNRDATIDLSPTSGLSDDDLEALRDPAAANKKAYEKMTREAVENSKGYNNPNNWQGGWGK